VKISTWIVLGAITTCAASIGAFQQVTASRLSLYDAAAADVMSFAQALGQRGTAAGLILPEAAFAKARVGVAAEKGPPQRTVDDAVQRFNGSRSDLRASLHGRTLLVRGVEEPDEVKLALDRHQPIAALEGVSAGDAILRYASAVLGPSPAPSAVISTGPLPGPSCPVGKRVNVPNGEKSVIELLNAIVEQAPGMVWLITYDANKTTERLKIGYACPDGVFRRVVVAGW
jgi:hypothetical protein